MGEVHEFFVLALSRWFRLPGRLLTVTDHSQKAISEPFVRQVQVPIFAVSRSKLTPRSRFTIAQGFAMAIPLR